MTQVFSSMIFVSSFSFFGCDVSETFQVAWFTMSEPFSGLGTTMPASSVEALNHAARISAKNARAEVIDFGAMMRGCAQLTSNTGLPCDGYIQMQESLWYVRMCDIRCSLASIFLFFFFFLPLLFCGKLCIFSFLCSKGPGLTFDSELPFLYAAFSIQKLVQPISGTTSMVMAHTQTQHSFDMLST